MYISLQCNVNFVISRLYQKQCLFWKGSPQITYLDSENGCWRGKSIGYVHNHRGRPSFLHSALFFLPKKNDTLSNKTVPKESFNPHTAFLEGNTHKNISNFNPGCRCVNAHLQGSLGCRDPAINCTRRGFLRKKYTPEKNVQLSTLFCSSTAKRPKDKDDTLSKKMVASYLCIDGGSCAAGHW